MAVTLNLINIILIIIIIIILKNKYNFSFDLISQYSVDHPFLSLLSLLLEEEKNIGNLFIKKILTCRISK